jgi:hypothetical protein
LLAREPLTLAELAAALAGALDAQFHPELPAAVPSSMTTERLRFVTVAFSVPQRPSATPSLGQALSLRLCGALLTATTLSAQRRRAEAYMSLARIDFPLWCSGCALANRHLVRGLSSATFPHTASHSAKFALTSPISRSSPSSVSVTTLIAT